MSAQDEGGPAFPCDSREARQFTGMTLRDWFASQHRFDADSPGLHQATAAMGEPPPEWSRDPAACLWWWAKAEARIRYMVADAMLVERARKVDVP